MTSVTPPSPIDRLLGPPSRRKQDHRKPPKGVKIAPRDVRIAFLLERDGSFCQCGCSQVIDPKRCEIEHFVPLWKVAHLPDEQRAKYFMPENERLYAPLCQQKKKNADEAAERAHFKRLAKNQVAHVKQLPELRLRELHHLRNLLDDR